VGGGSLRALRVAYARPLHVVRITRCAVAKGAVAMAAGGSLDAITPDACRLRFSVLTRLDAAAAAAPHSPADASEPAAGGGAAPAPLPIPHQRIKPVSELVQGEFRLDHFREYVKLSVPLPSMAAGVPHSSLARGRSDDSVEAEGDAVLSRAAIRQRAIALGSATNPGRSGLDAAGDSAGGSGLAVSGRHHMHAGDEGEDEEDRPLTRDEILARLQGTPGCSVPSVMLGDGKRTATDPVGWQGDDGSADGEEASVDSGTVAGNAVVADVYARRIAGSRSTLRRDGGGPGYPGGGGGRYSGPGMLEAARAQALADAAAVVAAAAAAADAMEAAEATGDDGVGGGTDVDGLD